MTNIMVDDGGDMVYRARSRLAFVAYAGDYCTRNDEHDKNWNPKSTFSQLAVLVAVLQIRDMGAYSNVYEEPGRKQFELLQRVDYCEYQTVNFTAVAKLEWNGCDPFRHQPSSAVDALSARQTFHNFFNNVCLSPQLPLRRQAHMSQFEFLISGVRHRNGVRPNLHAKTRANVSRQHQSHHSVHLVPKMKLHRQLRFGF
jgi:hypothetical protein